MLARSLGLRLFSALHHDDHGPVVQWIGRWSPKPQVQVRFLSGPLFIKRFWLLFFSQLFSAFWCEAEHDVKYRAEFAGFGFRDWREIYRYRSAGFFVLDAHEHHVLIIALVSLDVALRHQQLFALGFDFEMNVRRAARITDRFDGAEQVFTFTPREKSSETLEIFVAFIRAHALAVEISTFVIALPNFYFRAPHRLTFGIEDSTAEVGDLAERGAEGIVENEQIIISIERQVIRIKGAFRLLWSLQ